MTQARAISFLLAILLHSISISQNTEEKINITIFDGTIVAGYVDQGAYLNFLGPNINLVKGNSKITLGMLPSLRFKEDNNTPKNSLITPNLGGGITYTYKNIAFQIPLYYNSKTSIKNGKWVAGFGIGYRFK